MFHFFRKWMDQWDQWRNRKYPQDAGQEEQAIENDVLKKAFSPLTYQNPCVPYMDAILGHVLRQKKIPYQKLELVIIDAEEGRGQDDDDIEMLLYGLDQRLNYLLLITDRPEWYEKFVDEMYEENGLIVQRTSKSARRQARGNVVLDFERSGGVLDGTWANCRAIYLPVYKRPWEIRENLDIMVPVGYNTLVVDGIFPLYEEEGLSINERFRKDRMLDRLDREFRKG